MVLTLFNCILCNKVHKENLLFAASLIDLDLNYYMVKYEDEQEMLKGLFRVCPKVRKGSGECYKVKSNSRCGIFKTKLP